MYYTSSGQHEIAFKLYSLSIDEGWSTLANSNYAAADDAKVALRELSKTIRIDLA